MRSIDWIVNNIALYRVDKSTAKDELNWSHQIFKQASVITYISYRIGNTQTQ